MQFEEVILSDPGVDYEIEYITEDTEEDGLEDVPVSPGTAANVKDTDDTPPVKKKIPIIRKPGETVTPVQVRPTGNVKVSPLTSNYSSRGALTARSKVKWKKVVPPLSQVPLSPAPSVETTKGTPVRRPESKDVEQDHEVFDHEYAEAVPVTNVKERRTQMDRIEQKLDMILEKLNQHDAAFKAVKYNMKDLQQELKNSINDLKELAGETFDGSPPSKRKRLVFFPVADDNDLLRLENLLKADNQIQGEVTMLFKQAPRTSVYEFLRTNIYALFENCSKYSWTGRPSNTMPMNPPTNVARDMALVDHLITCAWETFPHLTRETIAKDFRRALGNFNETIYYKRKKRMEMKLKKAGLLNDFDASAEADD